MKLQGAVRRASRTPFQVAAMVILGIGFVLSVFGGTAAPFFLALPFFGLLMFLGTRPRSQRP